VGDLLGPDGGLSRTEWDRTQLGTRVALRPPNVLQTSFPKKRGLSPAVAYFLSLHNSPKLIIVCLSVKTTIQNIFGTYR
jgi:hypothetical protein